MNVKFPLTFVSPNFYPEKYIYGFYYDLKKNKRDNRVFLYRIQKIFLATNTGYAVCDVVTAIMWLFKLHFSKK